MFKRTDKTFLHPEHPKLKVKPVSGNYQCSLIMKVTYGESECDAALAFLKEECSIGRPYRITMQNRPYKLHYSHLLPSCSTQAGNSSEDDLNDSGKSPIPRPTCNPLSQWVFFISN